MALTGERKKSYQRVYMRDYRRKQKLLLTTLMAKQGSYVRPSSIPKLDADGNVIYDE